MRDLTRGVLVVVERPHAWALLRDRLDPALVRVAWSLPATLPAALAAALPWALAADLPALPESALQALSGRLVALHWVGTPPAGLPTRPLLHADWADLAADLECRLRADVGGLRLAPSNGLRLPGGGYLRHTALLEVLIGAHPEGLELDGGGGTLAAAVRGLRRTLERTGAPLELVAKGATIKLVDRDGDDAGAR